MTPLRQRMLDALELRGMAAHRQVLDLGRAPQVSMTPAKGGAAVDLEYTFFARSMPIVAICMAGTPSGPPGVCQLQFCPPASQASTLSCQALVLEGGAFGSAEPGTAPLFTAHRMRESFVR